MTRDEFGRFLPGVSGNPAGRPKSFEEVVDNVSSMTVAELLSVIEELKTQLEQISNKNEDVETVWDSIVYVTINNYLKDPTPATLRILTDAKWESIQAGNKTEPQPIPDNMTNLLTWIRERIMIFGMPVVEVEQTHCPFCEGNKEH
jgi:hypothetical protein